MEICGKKQLCTEMLGKKLYEKKYTYMYVQKFHTFPQRAVFFHTFFS